MNLKQRNIYILLGLFFLTHLILYKIFGIVSTNEAEKYIQQANLLLQGQFPSSSKYYYYLPIIFLIALAQKFSLGYGFVVFIQCIFAAFGIVLYYAGTKKVFTDKVALLSSALLCLFLPFFSWNFYLYSESLFITLSLILYYLICQFEDQQKKTLFLIFGVFTIMVFSRPFGVLFIFPLFTYFLFSRYKSKRIKFFALTLSVAFLGMTLVFINKIFHGGEDMDAMKPFQEEHIICFVPQKPEGAKLDLKYYDNGIRDIAYYITHNPDHFTMLMFKRLFSFFSLTRPWYSKEHNLALRLFIIPIYLFFIAGTVTWFKRKKNAFYYFIWLVIFYPLAVTFQCDDWNGRFTMLVLPPIFALAAFGIYFFLRIIRPLKN